MQFVIQPYTDGDEPTGFEEIVAALKTTWQENYSGLASLEIREAINLKLVSNRNNLPSALAFIERIRNPDLYLSELQTDLELGGVEITDHSPDGSNIEKRYPFIWASRRVGTNAFAASRYLKQRPGGQINRLPFRHANRNLEFLKSFLNGSEVGSVVQFLPIAELHLDDVSLIPPGIREHLANWSDVGRFFAFYLAARRLPPEACSQVSARTELLKFKDKLTSLANACAANATRETEASTLLKLPGRWIQVYNTRPDSGHWERGEGQFDSIDGRVMFTLDELQIQQLESKLEFQFWLPQMVSTHAWITEQRERDFGSKRLRNLLVELAPLCTTKFADQLSEGDWELLRANRGLLLERLDWEPKIYRVVDLVPGSNFAHIATRGLAHRPRALLESIRRMLQNANLYFSAHRAYIPGWEPDLASALARLPTTAEVLIPRIPAGLLRSVVGNVSCSLVPAEACTKEQLHMLRQLHRGRE